MSEFRCSLDSLSRVEPMVGTAPPDGDLTLVEYNGPWPAEAIRDGRLPEQVKEFLAQRPMAYVIRRHGRVATSGTIRVFRWVSGVLTTTLTTYAELPGLDLDALAPGPDNLFLVCTNGDRDRCCAEFGRPIADALTKLWPDEVWEVNHLGGHRFAGTYLHLPSGLVLGRLDPESAVADAATLRTGLVPVDTLRGRMGLPRAAQVAEWLVRVSTRIAATDAVRVASVDGEQILVEADGERWRVVVETERTEPFYQSCSKDKAKATESFRVVSAGPLWHDG